MYTLHKETFEGYWVYSPFFAFLRWPRRPKRVKFDNSLYRGKGRYRHFSVTRIWYDNETRKFMTEEERLLSFDEVLRDGFAIYDWRLGKMRYPTEEAARHRAFLLTHEGR